MAKKTANGGGIAGALTQFTVPHSTVTALAITGTQQIINGRADRYMLWINNITANGMLVSPIQADIGTPQGIYVAQGTPLLMTFRSHGVLVTMPWFAVALGTPSSAYVIDNAWAGGQ